MAAVWLDPVLQVRMGATAVIVIAVSWSVGAFGPWVGGALAGLPMVLGPGFFFLIQQSPPAFVSETATYALLSLSATQLFLLAYILAARKARPLAALGAAILTWALAALVCRQLPPWPGLGLVLFVAVTLGALRATAGLVCGTPSPAGKAAFHVLVFRGLLAGALVASITKAADWLGSAGAGVLLAFPVGYTVISTTVHEKLGAATAITTIRSALGGGASLAVFCLLMAMLPRHMSSWHALLAATVGSVLPTLVLVLRSRGRAMPPRSLE